MSKRIRPLSPVDHMESKNDVNKTRCGLNVNAVPGYLWEYGAIEAYCQRCQALHKKDLEACVTG